MRRRHSPPVCFRPASISSSLAFASLDISCEWHLEYFLKRNTPPSLFTLSVDERAKTLPFNPSLSPHISCRLPLPRTLSDSSASSHQPRLQALKGHRFLASFTFQTRPLVQKSGTPSRSSHRPSQSRLLSPLRQQRVRPLSNHDNMEPTEMDIDNEEHIFSNSSSSDDDEEDQTHSRGHSHPSAENHEQTQDMATCAPTDPNSRNSTPVEEPQRPIVMTARAYQIEMLEESLKQNVIVAVRVVVLGP